LDNTKMPDEFHFFLSSDLSIPVQVKILNLEGNLEYNIVGEDQSIICPAVLDRDLYVTCTIFSEGKQLTTPARTTFSFSGARWGQWLRLPIKYEQLPVDSQMVLTVWGVDGPRKKIPIGGTTFSLFGKSKTLRKGKQNLVVWRGSEGDGGIKTTTPGKSKTVTELDRLEKTVKKYHRNQIPKLEWLDELAFQRMAETKNKQRSSSDDLILCVELPTFEYPVLFNEKEYEYEAHFQPTTTAEKQPLQFSVPDPEISIKDVNQKPIDNKFLKLVFNRKIVDPDLRPNPAERDRIERILNYPITRQLTLEDKDVLWKFRFYLTSNRKALTKFIRCVDWENPQEAKHATELINQWQPIETSDALELLSKSFTSNVVRDYAVSRLEKASNEELGHYLLQLVQSLRYDSHGHESRLGMFLIERAVPDVSLRNFLYWYLRVEGEDPKYKKLYEAKFKQFKEELKNYDRTEQLLKEFQFHEDLIQQLSNVYKELRALKATKKVKNAKFTELLQPSGAFHQLAKFGKPIPLPVEPNINILGIIPEKVKVFTSSMEPLGIRFRTTKDDEYNVIFKCGDDLRQDQVIIQLMSLMDNLLKKENLDLKLSPYKVLATSTKDGMLECVQNSHTITYILQHYQNDILNYLRQYNPNPTAPNGIDPDVINTFVRSCAGYCVITFILCVGDRHLDNLLITTKGNLFHIDFGFIGRDPKPYPPPMKLCSEMVAAMGGEDSKDWELFKQLCIEAYNILRKNANLILNLVSLMADANIPDIANDKCLLQIQDKFQLDKNDQEAGESLQKLMQESVTALFPRLSERIHKWKMYWDNR